MVTHPLHYIFGLLTHAPTILPRWFNEPTSYKVRMLFMYALLFASSGFAMGGGSVGVAMGMVLIYSVMICFLASPQVLFDKSAKGFLTKLSDAFINAALVFHGFLIAHLVFGALVGLYVSIMNYDIFIKTQYSASVSAGLFAMYGVQAAQARFSNVRGWHILMAMICATMMVYVAAGLSMENARMMISRLG